MTVSASRSTGPSKVNSRSIRSGTVNSRVSSVAQVPPVPVTSQGTRPASP
ncbi:MAG TPA: hypothetical protein VII59_00040 [Streptosporangiaceae bacterium]